MDIERYGEVLLLIELIQSIPDLDGGVYSLLGGILQSLWYTKQHHHTIAYELVDGTSMRLYAVPHHAEAVIHGTRDLFRVQLLRHSGETRNVCEHYGSDTAFRFNGRNILCHRVLFFRLKLLLMVGFQFCQGLLRSLQPVALGSYLHL